MEARTRFVDSTSIENLFSKSSCLVPRLGIGEESRHRGGVGGGGSSGSCGVGGGHRELIQSDVAVALIPDRRGRADAKARENPRSIRAFVVSHPVLSPRCSGANLNFKQSLKSLHIFSASSAEERDRDASAFMRRHQAFALPPVALSAETKRGQPGDNLGSSRTPYLAMATLMTSISPLLAWLSSTHGNALGSNFGGGCGASLYSGPVETHHGLGRSKA